jgi:hypothetical protein
MSVATICHCHSYMYTGICVGKSLWIGNVLPQLARLVLFEVIREIQLEIEQLQDEDSMKVSVEEEPMEMNAGKGKKKATEKMSVRSQRLILYVCDGEADRDIARMSEENGWLIISNDSDFYLHASVAGYIPLAKILEADEHVSLPVYSSEEVEKILKLRREFFPLLATLVGNDYMEEVNLRKIHRGMGFPLELAEDVSRIRKLCEYLRKFESLGAALASFVGSQSFQSQGGPALMKLIQDSMAQFGSQHQPAG